MLGDSIKKEIEKQEYIAHRNRCETCWLFALTFQCMVGSADPACKDGARLLAHAHPLTSAAF